MTTEITKKNRDFDVWLMHLNRIARNEFHYKCTYLSETTGTECWRSYYDDGMTPSEALREDMSHA